MGIGRRLDRLIERIDGLVHGRTKRFGIACRRHALGLVMITADAQRPFPRVGIGERSFDDSASIDADAGLDRRDGEIEALAFDLQRVIALGIGQHGRRLIGALHRQIERAHNGVRIEAPCKRDGARYIDDRKKQNDCSRHDRSNLALT